MQDLFAKAISLHEQGNYQQAKQLYDDFLQQNPDNAAGYHQLGLLWFAEKNFVKANDSICQAIKLDATQPQYYNNLGNVFVAENNLSAALEHYLQAIQLDDNYVDAKCNLAMIYHKQQQFLKAMDLYQAVLIIDPNHCQSHYNLGLLYLAQGNTIAACEHLQQASNLNPNSIVYLHQYANTLLLTDQLTHAKELYSQLLSLQPNHVDILNNLGVIALKQADDQEAINYFTKVIMYDNNHLEARNNLAAIFMQHNRYENAITHYVVILDNNPNNTEALYNIGVAEMSIGKLADSIQHFQQNIKLNNSHVDSYINLGVIYLQQHQYELAKTNLLQALELDPNNKYAKFMLAALTNNAACNIAPVEYVANLFNNYAEYYDHHMCKQLSYNAPAKLFNLFTQHYQHLNNLVILDLGVGTGLVGEYFAPLAKSLVGVDIASKMLEQAARKGCYHQLICNDITDYLATNDLKVDLIVLADVLGYFGNLTKMFTNLSQHLLASGKVLFTIELTDQADFLLQPTTRFAHSIQYVTQQAELNGFSIIEQVIDSARNNAGESVSMVFYLMEQA